MRKKHSTLEQKHHAAKLEGMKRKFEAASDMREDSLLLILEGDQSLEGRRIRLLANLMDGRKGSGQWEDKLLIMSTTMRGIVPIEVRVEAFEVSESWCVFILNLYWYEKG